MTIARPGRKRLPNRREHTLINFTTSDGFTYTAGLGHFDDGNLAEIFLSSEKVGTGIETTARDSAVVASLALQHGVSPGAIRRALTRNSNGSASGPLGTLLDLLAEEKTADPEPETMSRPHLIATQDGLTAEIADPRLSGERLNSSSGHCPVCPAYPASNTPYDRPPAGNSAPAALQSRLSPVVASVLRCDAPGSNRTTALASADLQREAL